ncbi:AAA family ATPase [Candidatus Woesearchaeota archaeon]|nr:AAA family ATPase [Candidatus Woesearchaeota archaeon]
MQIRSLKLHNIRSYKDAMIDFPSGSVLLSGDIGAGKSTIMYAIEFALFGIKRGELSGSALLRHGSKQGHVELALDIDNKSVIIRRGLKSQNSDIKQDSGFIVVDGVKTEGTAVELKARVLDILGYPKELITKGKDLIYRFTVYTPQEEMKTILFEHPDIRLDTLRKLFGIDKYKRIRENVVTYIRELKEMIREYDAKTFGLEDKITLKKEKGVELERLKNRLAGLLPDLSALKKEIAGKKTQLGLLEKDMRKLVENRNNIRIIETQLMDRFLSARRNKEKADALEKQLFSMKKELAEEGADTLELKAEALRIQELIEQLESEAGEHNKTGNEAGVRISHSEEVIEKITRIDCCPMCEQGVSTEHKKKISTREKEIIARYTKIRDAAEDKARRTSAEIKKLKDNLSELIEKQQKAAVQTERATAIKGKEKEVHELKAENLEIKKSIGSLNMKKIEFKNEIELLKETEAKHEKARKAIDEELKKERELEINKASYETAAREAEKAFSLYEAEIRQKQGFRDAIGRITKTRNWLEEYFLNLMVIMEKHIMAQLHREFNELFTEWFRILISDEAINVRLDEQFTPLIEQNGYETELANLSGGEKTSVALAYRLALNKVINDFISHIKTKDIIMLDEPTDGFSDEQLDKVREVLEQINASQVIIVSHEAKIESFVDRIIRVDKIEHKSFVS